MKLAGKTDVGRVRQDNQDDYRAGELPGDAAWLLVCDGMGGARVSEKHCGFVINTGDATAEDVTELIRQVAERVKAQSGVTLEPEVKLLGEF